MDKLSGEEAKKAMERAQRQAEGDHSRYGEAYVRILKRLEDRSLQVESQAPLKPNSLWDTGTPEYNARLDEIQERVNTFLAKIAESIAYDLESPAASKARESLDDCVILYAMGGVDVHGVEACVRAFVKACKRPLPQERGSRTPPTPPPGTYPGRTQPAYRRELAKPPKITEVERRPKIEGEPQEMDCDTWRVARLEPGYTPSGLTYFVEKPLEPGKVGYARLNTHSVSQYPANLWRVQFLDPENRIGYHFPLVDNVVKAYQEAEAQDAIEALFQAGFTSKK